MGWFKLPGSGAAAPDPFTPAFKAVDIALRNTDGVVGVWSDITSSLSGGPAVDTFSALTEHASFYLGSDSPFPAFYCVITTALVPSQGAPVFEYWNGSVWAALPVYVTKGNFTLATRGNVWGEVVESQYVHLGPTTSWATLSLNGSTKYWIRARIDGGAITTSCQLDTAEEGVDTTLATSDGKLHSYGTAERYRDTKISWKDYENTTPGNYSVDFSAAITLQRLENEWRNGLVSHRYASVVVPDWADTSWPLEVEFDWGPQGAGTGTVSVGVRVAVATPGDDFDGALPELDGGLKEELVTITGDPADRFERTVVQVDISEAAHGDRLAIQTGRDATRPGDDFNNHCFVVEPTIRFKRYLV